MRIIVTFLDRTVLDLDTSNHLLDVITDGWWGIRRDALDAADPVAYLRDLIDRNWPEPELFTVAAA